MTLFRRGELQTAVLVLRVVPATEGQYPLPGILDGGKAVDRVVRPVFAGPEQRLCIGIVVAHPGAAEGGGHANRRSVSRMLAPFIGLPLSECSTSGRAAIPSDRQALRISPAARSLATFVKIPVHFSTLLRL